MTTLITDLATALLTIGSILGFYQVPEPQPNLGAVYIRSVQLAASPGAGECLTTDGTDNDWASCGGGGVSGGTAGMLTSWVNSTTLTATSGPTASFFYATSSSATSTFKGAVQIGATAGSNAFKLTPTSGTSYSTSESVGGLANINTGTTNVQGLVIYNNAAAGGTRALSVVCDDATLDTQCGHFRGDGVETILNVLGAPTGKGIVKIGSNGVGDADASGISIDTSLSSFTGQGIFLKGNTSGKLLNVRGSTDIEYLTMLSTGFLGLSTTTPGHRLAVQGDMFIAGNITSTSSLASVFPYATTTVLTASTLLTVGSDTAGVHFTQDGDGALTIQGVGNANSESATLNLDDTADVGVWSSGTGLVAFDFPNIRNRMDGLVIDGDATFPASSDGSILIGDGSDSGTFEVEDAPACIGDGGCTPNAADGSLLIATILGVGGTSTPAATLGVNGDIFAGRMISTSSLASIFPYASTTAITAASALYVGTNAVQPFETKGFSFGTSTQGSGTTTRDAYVFPVAATIDNISCHSNVYMQVALKDGAGNFLDVVRSSSTVSTFTFTTGNTFTAHELLQVDITSTTSPSTNVYGMCRYNYRNTSY